MPHIIWPNSVSTCDLEASIQHADTLPTRGTMASSHSMRTFPKSLYICIEESFVGTFRGSLDKPVIKCLAWVHFNKWGTWISEKYPHSYRSQWAILGDYLDSPQQDWALAVHLAHTIYWHFSLSCFTSWLSHVFYLKSSPIQTTCPVLVSESDNEGKKNFSKYQQYMHISVCIYVCIHVYTYVYAFSDKSYTYTIIPIYHMYGKKKSRNRNMKYKIIHYFQIAWYLKLFHIIAKETVPTKSMAWAIFLKIVSLILYYK